MAVTSRALVSEGAPAWKTDQSMGRTAESAGAGGFVTGGYTRRKKAVGIAVSMETLSTFVAVEPDTANQFVLRPTFSELVCSCNCQPVQPAGQLTRNSPSASTPAVEAQAQSSVSGLAVRLTSTACQPRSPYGTKSTFLPAGTVRPDSSSQPSPRRTEEKRPEFFVTRRSNAPAAPALADLARSLERFRHTRDRSRRPCSREVVHRLKIEPVLRGLAKGTGGYTGKSSGGPPGSVVLARGFQTLSVAVRTLEATQ